ncbi:hypothetical protein PVK06_006642 [Gossypium arboreum]|uniref:Transposase MuDR plant domain-containing protein n=1 Tax=Gossypium arboreum TaxID=29729 RepID=A0ABR0QF42_GOSAR|nr:hypothetical protein PVK06_006642 [Gossypium arboreum]
MKVLSIRYRFCASIDPVTYDSFDIKCAGSLEAMVQTHLASGTPYIELYVQFASPNDTFAAAVREEYTTPARHSFSGLQELPFFVAVWNTQPLHDTLRRDDVLPMTSTGERTSYVTDDGVLDDGSDVDPPREPGRNGTEVGLFSEPKPIPTEPEDVERGSDEEENPRFRAYSPPAHMHNVDLSADDALEFPDLPHRTRDHTSSLLDSSEFEVGKEFSNKDSFLGALKQHSINNSVNYHVVKSKSDKFKAKCTVQDGSCSWKIYASLRKKTGFWEIKKYKGPHTYAAGISQDHPKMDSAMLASLILLTVKADPRTSVPVLIANIHNQIGYTPSYRKAWIAKQKALEKMHSGWDASYNEIWQWCQVLERYILGCITDLQTEPAYYNDQLLRGCQVFKRLFWSFKQCRDAFAYCKPLVQIDGTFMHSRYTHRLLLAVAQDGSGRIFPIAFAITPGESIDD